MKIVVRRDKFLEGRPTWIAPAAHQAARRRRPRVAAGVGEGPPPPPKKETQSLSNSCSGSESVPDHLQVEAQVGARSGVLVQRMTDTDPVGYVERCEGPSPEVGKGVYKLEGRTARRGGEVAVPFLINGTDWLQGFSFSLDFDEVVLEAGDVEMVFQKRACYWPGGGGSTLS